MRPLIFALTLSAALWSNAAFAQQGVRPASGVGPSDTEKIKQVFVYGDDPCPPSEGEEIVVCARMPDNERYRIPADLRTDPNSPAVQSWANRARSIETVGAMGINTCSPVGSGGYTGCFTQIANAAREERKTMLGSATWADAVAKERESRLGNLDAESAQIEVQAKAEEAAAARKQAADAAADKAKANQQGPSEPK
jgi:hypothetical protein